jgi:hypothetical protein
MYASVLPMPACVRTYAASVCFCVCVCAPRPVLTVLNHFLWFSFFSAVYYRFAQVAAFFALCVWVVPFMFFISLSASDNTLPSVDASAAAAAADRRGRNRIGNRVLAFFHLLMRQGDSLLPTRTRRDL